MNSKNLGMRIKEQRENNSLSQSELANIIGISKQSLSNFENGIKTPSLDSFIKISNALQCSPDDLLKDYIALDDYDIYYYKIIIENLGKVSSKDIKKVAKLLENL